MEGENLQAFCEELKRDILFRMNDECLVRIVLCVKKLSLEQLWWRPNEESNSIGNLILHLCGNITQWVMTGLGGLPDMRMRQYEFDTRDHISGDKLLEMLESVVVKASTIICHQTATQLLEKRPVQTFEESGISILVHVTEHFSYHTGQIAWITKMLTNNQVGFYEGMELGG